MQRYRLFLFLFEKFSGLLHIFLDGGLERLHRFKLHFRTQELMQLHMDHLAVQIVRAPQYRKPYTDDRET